MNRKKIGLIVAVCIVIALILTKCMPTNVAAEVIGPPTIETYLQSIHSGMIFIKWLVGIVGTLFVALIGVIVYAYKRDISEVKEDANEAKKNAHNAFTEINVVKRDFISTKNHDRACPHIGG